jgi:nickel-dependent lactate racemase
MFLMITNMGINAKSNVVNRPRKVVTIGYNIYKKWVFFMTDIRVPYGKTDLTATIDYPVDIISPKEASAADDPIVAVTDALNTPLGDMSLEQFQNIESVAIAINDKTRPVPHQHLLPPLLDRLEKMGIAPERITLVIATGTHPVMPPEEYPMILPPEIIERYPIVCHDAYKEETHIYLGETEDNTPVFINKNYMSADLRIVVGNIEPHQFQGFSGGVKSAAIGLAGAKTINHNHAMMTHENARLGSFHDNPARQDVEAIGRLIGVHFALNALLNGKKEIVEVLAGDPYAVMHAGIPRVKSIFEVTVHDPYDLLIVSPGGHPKDINVYQTQKALAHAVRIMKNGGQVILAAACPDGSGSEKYEDWMQGKESFQAVFDQFAAEGFHVGPHKAYQIARDAAPFKVQLISEMDDDFVRFLLLNPAPDLQTAIDTILDTLPENPRIGILPAGNATIPILTNA